MGGVDAPGGGARSAGCASAGTPRPAAVGAAPGGPIWADPACAGQLTTWSDGFLLMTLKTVSRPRSAKGFVVLPRRWKVERTLGWTMKARRNVRDYERLPQHSEAHVTWALITLMTRRRKREGSRTAWPKEPERTDPL